MQEKMLDVAGLVALGVLLSGIFLLLASVLLERANLPLSFLGAVLVVYALVGVANPGKLSLLLFPARGERN